MNQKNVFIVGVRNSLLALLFSVPVISQGMPGMSAMESSVGFLSSGTSVEPKSTSEFEPMVFATFGNWTLMFHANAFVVDTQQTGPRGRDKFYSTNWMMPMLTREFGRHSFSARTMLSLEPATVTKRRYPELFQSGETAYGLPIIDGQHPHDFIMELAGRYEFRVSDRTQVFLYGGPVGDPALGPTAFSHRASASENPVATLGHHQEDSTHISNNVVTVGLVRGHVQLEASTFHGREPNENRWNIDGGTPDSFASRLTIGLTNSLTGQFSAGRINNREALEPTTDTFRMTASLSHDKRFSSGHIASTLIWGRNKDLPGHDASPIFNSYTLESTINFANKNWAWIRLENVDRDRTILADEMVLRTEEDPIGRIQAYTFGYERDLPIGPSHLKIGLGSQVTVYGMPQHIKAVYGNRPAAFTMFFRIRPRGNMMEHMQLMHRK
jgi:hypothetical protein